MVKPSKSIDKIAKTYIEHYGFLILCLWCFSLLPPDISSKQMLMELDLDMFNEEISASSVSKQVFWMFFFLCYGAIFFNDIVKGVLSTKVGHASCFLLAILALCSVSLAWSDSLYFTMKRLAFQLVLVTTWLFSVFYCFKNEMFLKNVRILAIVSILVSLLCIILGSGYWSGSFSGWAKNKNMMGVYCLSILSFYYLASSLAPKFSKLDVVIIVVLLLMLVATQSKTCLALALILSTSRAFRVYVNKGFLALYTLALVFIFCVFPFASYLLDSTSNISEYMSDDALTGRGFIWSSLYYDLFSFGNFLTGYGYGAYFSVGSPPWILDDAYSFSRFINSAHNSYLELLMQLGPILTISIFLVICLSYLSIEQNKVLTVIMVFLTYGVTESFLVRDQHVAWITFLTAFIFGILSKGDSYNESGNSSRLASG